MLIKNLPDNVYVKILIKRFFLDIITLLWHLLNFRPRHSISIIKSHISLMRLYNKIKKRRLKPNNYHKYFIINNLPYNYFVKGLKKFTDLKVNNNNLC